MGARDRFALWVQNSIVAHFLIVFSWVLAAIAALIGFAWLVFWAGSHSPVLAFGLCAAVLAAFIAGAIVSAR